MDASEHMQKYAQACPHPFTGTVCTSHLPSLSSVRMAHRHVGPLNRGRAIVLIGVDLRPCIRKLFNMGAQRGLFRILDDAQPHLATHTTNGAQDPADDHWPGCDAAISGPSFLSDSPEKNIAPPYA